MMTTYAFIGCGSAGASIARGLVAAGARVLEVCDSDPQRSRNLAKEIGARPVNVEDLATTSFRADTVFIAVPDPEISPTAERLAALNDRLEGRVFLHLAGRFGARALLPLHEVGAHVGSMHPAVSFPPGAAGTVPPGVTFAVEAKGRALAEARAAAELLAGHIIEIGDSSRSAYHAATVIAGNYPVTLIEVASDIVEGLGVNREEARRLVVELALSALSNARGMGPAEALSGPIRRGDAAAVADHLRGLDTSSHGNLYKELARSTLRLVRREGRLPSEALARLEALLG